MYRNFIKRTLDIIFSALLIIIFLPLMIIIFFVVKFWLDSRPIFTQRRPGLNEQIFSIYKFKTMKDLRGSDGELLPDAERLTPLGKFLRKCSLDELPQLFNVLKGDMSFIGPRPLLIEYLPLYSAEQRLRHSVRPGITGLAQVNGRNAITFTKKFEYDIFYARNLSFIMDVKIALLTIKKVLKSDGITQQNHATSEKFNGKN